MPENLPLFFDDIYGALRGFVSFAGGSKVIASRLFPHKSEDKATAWLDECLNPGRPAKLDPEELLHMVRLASEAGFHQLMRYIGDETNYMVEPREPKDELASLYGAYVDAAKDMRRLSEKIERAEQRSKVRALR